MADRRGKDPSGAEDPIGKNAEGGDDEDEEDEEEEEEPKLKYERIGNALTDILNQPKDAASCMAVHQKFLALGTHWGVVHVLDHQGNNIRSKEFPCHTSVVNEISIDNQGEYIASCSDEGRVVINGLYSTDNNMQNNFDRPIKAVAIDPDFSKKNTKMYVAGGDKLILMEKGWWIKSKSTVLHVGEGTISTIKWRSHYIAWANDVGVKVFDLSSKKLITHIKRDADSPRSDLYRCNLCWKDDVTLLIGWAKSVKVCVVKERPHHDARAALPSRFVEIVALFNTDYYISGIAPLKDDLVILSYVTEMDNTDSIKKTGSETAQRPQLRILATRGIGDHEEISADALSVRGFNKYRCNDYSLAYVHEEIKTTVMQYYHENVAEESLFYIISPRDIVLAKPRDMDDHITWLLEHEKFEEAMEIAESHKNC